MMIVRFSNFINYGLSDLEIYSDDIILICYDLISMLVCYLCYLNFDAYDSQCLEAYTLKYFKASP